MFSWLFIDLFCLWGFQLLKDVLPPALCLGHYKPSGLVCGFRMQGTKASNVLQILICTETTNRRTHLLVDTDPHTSHPCIRRHWLLDVLSWAALRCFKHLLDSNCHATCRLSRLNITMTVTSEIKQCMNMAKKTKHKCGLTWLKGAKRSKAWSAVEFPTQARLACWTKQKRSLLVRPGIHTSDRRNEGSGGSWMLWDVSCQEVVNLASSSSSSCDCGAGCRSHSCCRCHCDCCLLWLLLMSMFVVWSGFWLKDVKGGGSE